MDLLEISTTRDWEQKTQAKATELYKFLVDKTMPVVVAEFSDFLGVFETMSLRFQSKGGVMVGNVEIIRDPYDKGGTYLRHHNWWGLNTVYRCRKGIEIAKIWSIYKHIWFATSSWKPRP